MKNNLDGGESLGSMLSTDRIPVGVWPTEAPRGSNHSTLLHPVKRVVSRRRFTHVLSRFAGATVLALGLLAVLPAQATTTVTTVTYVYTDALGSPAVKADAQGNVIARYDYRPYGTQQDGPANTGPGYTGHVNDPDTGLVYMQQRYYDPEAGRFQSVDPVGPSPGNVFGFNRYDYANNNPVRFTDPTGMCGDVSTKVQRMRNTSDVSNGGVARCFVPAEGQTDFGTTIGTVPGYTESGSNDWRASNDWGFITAADDYNKEHNLKEGDDGYMSYDMLKAWAMVESGCCKKSFLSDPLQVNNPGDAAPDKLISLGLSRNQQMNPYSSAYSAENWWRHKGYLHDASGAEVSWRGDTAAFERYNANGAMDRSLNGQVVPHYVWYATQVLKLSAEMQGK